MFWLHEIYRVIALIPDSTYNAVGRAVPEGDAFRGARRHESAGVMLAA